MGRGLAHFVLAVREEMTLRRRYVLCQKAEIAKQYKDPRYRVPNHALSLRGRATGVNSSTGTEAQSRQAFIDRNSLLWRMRANRLPSIKSNLDHG